MTRRHAGLSRRTWGVVLVVLYICSVVAAAFGGAWLMSNWRPSGQISSLHDGNLVLATEEKDLAEIVNKVSESVVSIISSEDGHPLIGATEQAGTGIIISPDGYVLTNKHVIKGADNVEVIDSKGEKYSRVSLVGADPLNDIAFLKIEGANALPAAHIGNSGTVRVGQRVIAIGNSLGQYQNTVTSGIISGTGRPVSAASEDNMAEVEDLTDLLQTDAAINPGNSGGPLLNMSGQIIGINTAVVHEAQSIGFAIPINAAKGMIRSLFETGTLQKAYIGVRYLEITPEVRARLRLPPDVRGAVVQPGGGNQAVVQGGPAHKAGLQDNDIILRVNDKQVGKDGGLSSLIAEFLPGETVQLAVLRQGKELQVQLQLGAYTL